MRIMSNADAHKQPFVDGRHPFAVKHRLLTVKRRLLTVERPFVDGSFSREPPASATVAIDGDPWPRRNCNQKPAVLTTRVSHRVRMLNREVLEAHELLDIGQRN